jgi:glucosamine-6-phosphate deaminase
MLSAHLLARSRYEQAAIAVLPGSLAASRAVAAEIAALIRQRHAEKRPVVLGLATGSTPVSLYAELVRLHREEGLSFANVTTFNLDEYYPLSPEHAQSYRSFMRRHLFDHVDLDPARTHLPSGTVAKHEVDAHCAAYEAAIRAAGGIDFQILGIGRTGHIGFNEPGSPRHSLTRLVTLDPLTRRDAAGDFGGIDSTPRHALTMGVRSILDARRVVTWLGASTKPRSSAPPSRARSTPTSPRRSSRNTPPRSTSSTLPPPALSPATALLGSSAHSKTKASLGTSA